jgi:predicted restriction endonuclease
MLTASHIKPWAVCSSSAGRLDVENGLLLAPHVDRLFDREFICFEEDGMVTVSTKFSGGVLGALGLSALEGGGFGSFTSKQKEYLRFHRENVFLAALSDAT